MFELTDKVAIITGAGGFIGRETALTFVKQGAKVALCDIDENTLKSIGEEIRAIGGECKEYLLDVTDSKQIDSVVEDVKNHFGSVDISVHVAGGSARIAGGRSAQVALVDQKDEVLDKVLKVNLYGAMYLARACAREMIKQCKGGRIISFSSVVGVNGLWSCSDYAAAKAGVSAMSKSLAKEVGKFGITVNCIAPGVVARPDQADDDHYTKSTNYLSKQCTAKDIANLAVFMASEEAGFITGQTYIIDGGRCLANKGND